MLFVVKPVKTTFLSISNFFVSLNHCFRGQLTVFHGTTNLTITARCASMRFASAHISPAARRSPSSSEEAACFKMRPRASAWRRACDDLTTGKNIYKLILMMGNIN